MEPTIDRKEVARRLRLLRWDKKMNQADLAKALKTSPAAISMYERGERIPRDEIKLRFAEFYEMTVQELFYADQSESYKQVSKQ